MVKHRYDFGGSIEVIPVYWAVCIIWKTGTLRDYNGGNLVSHRWSWRQYTNNTNCLPIQQVNNFVSSWVSECCGSVQWQFEIWETERTGQEKVGGLRKPGWAFDYWERTLILKSALAGSVDVRAGGLMGCLFAQGLFWGIGLPVREQKAFCLAISEIDRAFCCLRSWFMAVRKRLGSFGSGPYEFSWMGDMIHLQAEYLREGRAGFTMDGCTVMSDWLCIFLESVVSVVYWSMFTYRNPRLLLNKYGAEEKWIKRMKFFNNWRTG